MSPVVGNIMAHESCYYVRVFKTRIYWRNAVPRVSLTLAGLDISSYLSSYSFQLIYLLVPVTFHMRTKFSEAFLDHALLMFQLHRLAGLTQLRN